MCDLKTIPITRPTTNFSTRTNSRIPSPAIALAAGLTPLRIKMNGIRFVFRIYNVLNNATRSSVFFKSIQNRKTLFPQVIYTRWKLPRTTTNVF